MLTRYVGDHHIDLVVMGSRARSTAAKLLDWLPCDTLLVHTTAAAT